MNNPRDDAFSAEEQERLLREREAALTDPSTCEGPDLAAAPDVDPVVPAETCGTDEETLSATFSAPNPVPAEPTPPTLLPDPLVVVSRSVSVSCPPGQIALVGTSPNVLAAGADTQLVYLDELAIPQAELFRLATYVVDLQAYVASELISAIDGDDLPAFDAGIVLITKTSGAVATLIREALVTAQGVADEVATLIATSALVCGWKNRELWVVCQDAEPGYSVSFTEPVGVESSHVAADLFESTISQADADEQAARSAALELACLVTNAEQDVFCSDAESPVDEQELLTWPVNWVKAVSARNAALGLEVVTLEEQGVGAWTSATWDDFESNTESIALSALNGQEFLQADNVGSGTRRRLRTRVIIPAGDPRTASIDVETANSIAYNLAVAELDCFVPNRPRVISCSTDVYGSAEVRKRHLGRGLAMNYAGRSLMFAELRAVSARLNAGVLSYGLLDEREDRGSAFEVNVWPGYVSGVDAGSANEQAGNYAAALLQCEWVSPSHKCLCVSSPTDKARVSVTSSSQVSSKFSTSELAAEDVILMESGSVDEHTIPAGLIVDSEYPNRLGDPAYDDPVLAWPDLPALCQTSLSCLFSSCKTVCCEPKPDDRPFKVNGMPNYATWNDNWNLGEARLQDQQAFMNRWNSVRSNRRFESCSGYDNGDDCDISRIPVSGFSNSIVSTGPNQGAYGTPARFKYGGVLRWGNQWAEAVPVDPNRPNSDELLLIGTVKACHKDSDFLQMPDLWGMYHCAEGYAEGFAPVGLKELARQNALSRLDCTHISWPRHLVNCAEPNQKAFGPPTWLNTVTEASSTREANEQLEQIALQMMSCRDTHNFMLTFNGSGGGGSVKLEIPAPVVANSGKSTCLPMGLSTVTFYEEDCETEVDLDNLPATTSSHVFVIVKCCEIGGEPIPEKRLILKIVPDSSIDYEIRTAGRQLDGQMGLQSGRDTLETIRLDNPHVWYIGSFSVRDLGNGTDDWAAERAVVQVHSGPITLDETCCSDSTTPQWELRVHREEGSAEPKAQIRSGNVIGLGQSTWLPGEPDEWNDISSNTQVFLRLVIEVSGAPYNYSSSEHTISTVWLPSHVSSASVEMYYLPLGEVPPDPTSPTINGESGSPATPGVYYFRIGYVSTRTGAAYNDYKGPLALGWCPPDSPYLTNLT